MLIKASSYQILRSNPGVYLFLDSTNEVLYVGKAKNLKDRVSSYFAKSAQLSPKTKILVSKTKKIKTFAVPSEIEALLLEAKYIKKHKPKYNSRLTDGKAYPLIRIIKDTFPKVLIARKTNDKNSIYFGPFPNSSAVWTVLRTTRKIFPYQSVVNHPKKQCLYYHLGLCPCPEIFGEKKEYRQNIKHLIDFLNGKTKKVIKNLVSEREKLSRNEEFEKAHDIQKKLEAIEYVTNPVYKTFDYKVNASLPEESSRKQINELVKELNLNCVFVKKLKRIECYDISNISGKSATGSMVVFINGEKETSQYRRFKIRGVDRLPNDFAMMQEVVERRIRHKEWEFPDLIIVDGGKGQVSSAVAGLKKQGVIIPVIGLAKREETIVTSNFNEIKLPKDSEALKLLMRIRDEAHRFAIKYHRLLRSKELTS